MATLDNILGDERFSVLGDEDKAKVLDSFYDDEIKAGRADKLDKFKTQNFVRIQSNYHGETDRRKPFLQGQFNALRELDALTRGADPKTRALESQRFIKKYGSFQKQEDEELKKMEEERGQALAILAGDPEEVGKDKDERGLFKGHFLGMIGEGAEGLIDTGKAAWEGSGGGVNIVGAAVGVLTGTNSRDQRAEKAEEAKKKLSAMGLSDKDQQALVDELREETRDFKGHKEEPIRKNGFGELMFNPETLARTNPQEMIKIIEDSDVAPSAKKRAIARLESAQHEAWMDIADVIGVSNIEERLDDDATWADKVDDYLANQEDRNAVSKFIEASGRNFTSSALTFTGGTLGVFGAKGVSDTLSDAAGLNDRITGQLKQGVVGGFSAELVGLVPDVVLAKGAGVAARGFSNLLRAKRVKAAGGALATAAEANMLALEAQIVKGGVAFGSGYGAAARTMNQALAMDMDYGDAAVLSFKQLLITGLVTRIGSNTGTERFATGATMKKEARQFWRDYVGKDIIGEGVEEFVDEMVSSLIVESEMNPDLDVNDAVDAGLHAFFLGSAMGGITTSGAFTALAEKLGGKPEPIEVNPAMELETSAVDFVDSPEAQDLRESQATQEDTDDIDLTSTVDTLSSDLKVGDVIQSPKGPSPVMKDTGQEVKTIDGKTVTTRTFTLENGTQIRLEDGETAPVLSAGVKGDTGPKGAEKNESAPVSADTPDPVASPQDKKGEPQVSSSNLPLDTSEEAPSIAEQVFGGEKIKGKVVRGSVAADQISTKADKDGKLRVHVRTGGANVATDRIYNPKTKTFSTEKNSKAPLKTSTFYGSAKAAPKTVSETSATKSLVSKGKTTESKLSRSKLLGGGGSAEIHTVEEKGKVEFKEDFDGREGYNPETDTIEVKPDQPSPAFFLDSVLATAVAERAALTSDNKIPASSAAFDPQVVQDIVGDIEGLTEDQKARMLIVAAARGNKKAMAEMNRVSLEGGLPVSSEIKNIYEDIATSNAGDKVKTSLKEGVERAQQSAASEGVNLGAANVGPDTVKKEAGMRSTVDEHVFNRLNKSKNNNIAELDSGRGDENNRIKKNLPTGSILEVKNAKGVVTRWMVMKRHLRDDGTSRHELRRLNDDNAKAEIDKIYTSPKVRDSMLKALRLFRAAKGATDGEATAKTAMKQVVREALRGIAGGSFVKDKLIFTNDTDNPKLKGRLMGVHSDMVDGKMADPHLLVNEDALFNYFNAHATVLDESNKVAEDSGAYDLSLYINQTLFEEVSHYYATSRLDQKDLVKAGREWMALSLEDDSAKSELVKWLGYMSNRLGQDQATRDQLWSEVTVLFDEDTPENAEALNRMALQVTHEAMAGFIATIKTGNTTLSMEGMINRWFNTWSLSESSRPGKDASEDINKQTLIGRLIEMAKRAVQAVRNYFNAHRQLNALPESLSKLVDDLETILDENNVIAPDPFNIKKKVLSEAETRLDQTINLIDSNFEIFKAQRNLQASLTKVREALGSDPRAVVTLRPNRDGTASMVLNSDLEDSIDPVDRSDIKVALGEINASGRPTRIMRNAADIADVQLVMRRLNLTEAKDGDEFGLTAGQVIGDDAQQRRALIRRSETVAEGILSNAIRGVSGTNIPYVGPESKFIKTFQEEYLKFANEAINREVAGISQIPSTVDLGARSFGRIGQEFRKLEDAASQFPSEESTANLSEFYRKATTETKSPEYKSTVGKELRKQRESVDRYVAAVSEIFQRHPLTEFANITQMVGVFDAEMKNARVNKEPSNFLYALESEGFRKAFPNARPDDVINALEEASSILNTTSALQNVAEEMDFALIGGRPPTRLLNRGFDGSALTAWSDINLTRVSDQATAIPFNMAQVVRTPMSRFMSNMIEDVSTFKLEMRSKNALSERFSDSEAKRNGQKVERLTELTRLIAQTKDDNALRQSYLKEALALNKDLEGIAGVQIQFEDGKGKSIGITFTDPIPLDLDAELKKDDGGASLGGILGGRLATGESLSFSMVGYDPTARNTGRRVPTGEITSRMRASATADAKRLTHQGIQRYFHSDDAIQEDFLYHGGFPIDLVTTQVPDPDNEGGLIPEVSPSIRPEFFELPEYPSDLVDNNLEWEEGDLIKGLIDKGVFTETLLEIAGRLDSMNEVESTASTNSVLRHDYGLTPAGYVYQMISNPFAALLARMKNPQSRIKVGPKDEDTMSIPEYASMKAGEIEDDGGLTKYRIDALFASLAPKIENASAFNQSSPFYTFINMRRLVMAGNVAYKATIDGLNSNRAINGVQRDAKISNDRTGQEENMPIDINLARYVAREGDMFEDERRNNEDSTLRTILSVIRPDRPQKLLDLYRVASMQTDPMVFKTPSHDTDVDSAGDAETNSAIRRGENQGNNLYTETQASFPNSIQGASGAHDAVDSGLQSEQDEVNRLAKWRTIALMEIHGRNLDLILKLLASPQYAKFSVNPNQNYSVDYNYAKIDADIVAILEKMAIEERERGHVHVFSGDTNLITEGVVDERLKEMLKDAGGIPALPSRPPIPTLVINGVPAINEDNIFEEKVEPTQEELDDYKARLTKYAQEIGAAIPSDLVRADLPKSRALMDSLQERGSSFKAFAKRKNEISDLLNNIQLHVPAGKSPTNEALALASVLHGGGTVLPGFRPDELELEDKEGLTPRHEASEWKVLTHLMSKIPGVRMIQGDLYNGPNDDSDTPTLAFVGTDDDPVVVAPFRYASQISNEDIHRVATELIKYISKKNGTSLTEIAQGILAPLDELHKGLDRDRVTSLVYNFAVKELAKKKQVMTERQESALYASVDTFRKSIPTLIFKELSGAPKEHWGEPSQAESGLINMDENLAADLIAQFMTSEPLKRVLTMATVGMNVPSVDGHFPVMGEILRSDLLFVEEFSKLAPFIQENAPDIDNFASDQEIADFLINPDVANFGQEEGLPDASASSIDGMSKFPSAVFMAQRFFPNGQDNANNLLLNALAQLGKPFEQSTQGILPKLKDQKLTEFEARQMIALFSDEDLRVLAEKAGMATGLPSVMDSGFGVPELMSWSAEAAQILIENYDAVSHSHAESQKYSVVDRWGLHAGSDHLVGRDPRAAKLWKNRMDSGRYAAAVRLIEADMGKLEATEGQYTVDFFDMTPEGLRERLIKAKLPTTIPNPSAKSNWPETAPVNDPLKGQVIDIVDRAWKEVTEVQKLRADNLEGMREQIRVETNKAEALEVALAQIAEVKRDRIDAPNAEAFWDLVTNSGELYDSLSMVPGARDTLDAAINAFFGGREQIVTDLAGHLLSMDSASARFAGRIDVGGDVSLATLAENSSSSWFDDKRGRAIAAVNSFEDENGVDPRHLQVRMQNSIIDMITLEEAGDIDGANGIKRSLMDLSTKLDNWARHTTKTFDAEFGKGILSRITNLQEQNIVSFPRWSGDLAVFTELRNQIENGRLEASVNEFFQQAQALSSPKGLMNRIQANQLSQSLQAFIDSPTHQKSRRIGDFTGDIMDASEGSVLSLQVADAGIDLSDLDIPTLLRTTRSLDDGSDTGKESRRQAIEEVIRETLEIDSNPLVAKVEAAIQEEMDNINRDFVDDVNPDKAGKVAAAIEVLEAMTSEKFNDLTPSERTETILKSMQQVVEMDMNVNHASLVTLANDQADLLIKNRDSRFISAFRGKSHKKVRINGTTFAQEVGQNVLTSIAKLHADYYALGYDQVRNLQGLARVEAAAGRADKYLVSREGVKDALEQASGEPHVFVGDMIAPADHQERIGNILARSGRAVTDGNIGSAIKEMTLFSAVGYMDDYQDFTAIPNLKPSQTKAEEKAAIAAAKAKDKKANKLHDQISKDVITRMTEPGVDALHYGDPDKGPGNENASKVGMEALGGRDMMAEIQEFHGSLYAYISKFNSFLSTVKNDFMGDDKFVVQSMAAMRERISTFTRDTGGEALLSHYAKLAKGEESTMPGMPMISRSTASNMLSIYTEAKAFMVGMQNGAFLEAGFVNAKILNKDDIITGAIRGMMHHDSKVRHLFARTMKGRVLAQGVSGMLDFGPSINGKAPFGRTGYFGMKDFLNIAIAKAAPKRRKLTGKAVDGSGRKKGLTEVVDSEEASRGYLTQSVISFLTSGKSISQQSQILVDVFEANDASFALVESTQKVNPGTTIKEKAKAAKNRTAQSLFGTNTSLLKDRLVYEQIKKDILPILRASAANTQMKAVPTRIWETMSEKHPEAAKYGQYLHDLFTYMKTVYQAQGQLIPKSEMTTDQEKSSWIDGNKHLLDLPAVPFRWQKVFSREQGVQGKAPDISDSVSMRGASWLKSVKTGLKADDTQLLDINGLRAPSSMLDDMAYRMNVSPALALVQELTGVAQKTDSGVSSTSSLEFKDDNRGILGTYWRGKDTITKASQAAAKGYRGQPLETRMEDIGLSLGRLSQEMVLNDIARTTPNNMVQDRMEDVSMVGMSSALVSIRQLIAQTLPAIFGYAVYRGGAFANLDISVPFLKHAMGSMRGGIGKIFSPIGSSKYSDDVARFVKDHAFALYLRNAEGIELFSDTVQSSNPRVRNRISSHRWKSNPVARNLERTIHAMAKGVKDGTIGLSKVALQKTIASGEKVVIQSIFMNEVAKRVSEMAGEKVSVDMLLNEKRFSQYFTADVMAQSQLIAVDILGQSDTSRKAALFQRQEGIPAEMVRGMFSTFANHLLSTSANSYAGVRMARHGETSADRAEGRRLVGTSLIQNLAYQGMNFGFISWAVTKVLGAALGWDEEDRRQAIEWIYGLEDGPEERYGTFNHYVTQYILGSRRPFGYRLNQGVWEETQFKKDFNQLGVRAGMEFLNQTPGIGLFTSTALGGSASNTMLSKTSEGVFDVEGFDSKRAGISLGKPGEDGQMSDQFHKKLVYTTSMYFQEWLAPRSYFFMGANFMAQPLYHKTNSQNDDQGLTTNMKILPSLMPFLPRDARADLWEYYDAEAEVSGWHNSYAKPPKIKWPWQ